MKNQKASPEINDDFYYDEEGGVLHIVNTTAYLLFVLRRIIRNKQKLCEIQINGGGGYIVPALDIARLLGPKIQKGSIVVRVTDPSSAGGIYACMRGTIVNGSWAVHGIDGPSPAVSRVNTRSYLDQIVRLPFMDKNRLTVFSALIDEAITISIASDVCVDGCYAYAYDIEDIFPADDDFHDW